MKNLPVFVGVMTISIILLSCQNSKPDFYIGKWAGRTSEQTWQFSQGLKDHMLSREFISFNGDGTGTYTVDFDFTATYLKAKLEQTLSWKYIKMENEDEATVSLSFYDDAKCNFKEGGFTEAANLLKGRFKKNPEMRTLAIKKLDQNRIAVGEYVFEKMH